MVIARALDVSYDVFSEIEGQPVQGAARSKVLFEGEETVLEKITFENGAFSSAHQHPYETIGHILRGRAEVTIGNETYRRRRRRHLPMRKGGTAPPESAGGSDAAGSARQGLV